MNRVQNSKTLLPNSLEVYLPQTFYTIIILYYFKILLSLSKAKKALFALRLLRPFFDKTKMRTLLDSNFYSILYYNASIWLTPDLSAACKHDLLAVSSLALRSCLRNQNNDISFVNLHKNNNKCHHRTSFITWLLT